MFHLKTVKKVWKSVLKFKQKRLRFLRIYNEFSDESKIVFLMLLYVQFLFCDKIFLTSSRRAYNSKLWICVTVRLFLFAFDANISRKRVVSTMLKDVKRRNRPQIQNWWNWFKMCKVRIDDVSLKNLLRLD